MLRNRVLLLVAFLLFQESQRNVENLRLLSFLSLLYSAQLTQMMDLLVLRRLRRRRLRLRIQPPFFWVLPRPRESWFEIHYQDHTIPGDYFRRQLRLNRDTFAALLNALAPRLNRNNTRLRDCIPPEKVLALALHRLGHGTSYVAIGPNFNVGRSTVLEATQDVVHALCELKDEYIKFPETLHEIRYCIESFEDLTNLPNVVGAIDGSHIEIKAPFEDMGDYFSRYQRYDVVVQAVVDGTTRFLDISAGYPGSMHDSRVLRNSTLYARAENREILTEPVIQIGGNEIGPYLLGDSAYPLSAWIQKPFSEKTNDPHEINFNKQLSSARVQVECACGCLKCRWRILSKRLDSRIEFTSKIILACAVLHNFCLREGDCWNQPDGNDDGDDCPNPQVMGNGEDIRELLKDHIYGM